MHRTIYSQAKTFARMRRKKSALMPMSLNDLPTSHIPKTTTVSIQKQETYVNVRIAYDGIGAQDSGMTEEG